MATYRPLIMPLAAATLAASTTLPAFAFEDDRLTIWMGDNDTGRTARHKRPRGIENHWV